MPRESKVGLQIAGPTVFHRDHPHLCLPGRPFANTARSGWLRKGMGSKKIMRTAKVNRAIEHSAYGSHLCGLLQSPPNEAAWSVALLAASSSCSLAPACTARLISAPVESERRSSDCSDPRALAITAAQLLAARMRPPCPQSGVATRHRALLCTPCRAR